MFGLTLTPAWGAVFAVFLLGSLLYFTHIVNLRVG